jgi:hypothetical protein
MNEFDQEHLAVYARAIASRGRTEGKRKGKGRGKVRIRLNSWH